MTQPTKQNAALYLEALDAALGEWERDAKGSITVWNAMPARVKGAREDLVAIERIRTGLRAKLAAAVATLPPPPAPTPEILEADDVLAGEFFGLNPSRAWYWSSHAPEHRASAAAADYVAQVAAWRSVRTPTRADDERHRRALLARWRAYLAAESRTASPVVAGPANFNRARNDRRMETARRRLGELLEFARRSAASPSAVIRQGDDDARVRLEAKLWAEQSTPRKTYDQNRRGRVKRLVDQLDALERRGRELDELPPQYETTIPREGAKERLPAAVTLDREADRILIATTKDEAANAWLRGHGFKWAPSRQMWSRQMTANALNVLRLYRIMPEAAPDVVAPVEASDVDAPDVVAPLEVTDLDAPDDAPDTEAAPDPSTLEEADRRRASYAAADPVAPASVEQPEAPLARVLSFPARPAPAEPPAPPPDSPRAEQLEQARASVRQLDDQLAELRLSLDRVQREQTPTRARPLAAELNSRIDVLQIERDRAAMNVARLEGAERSLDPVPDPYKPVAGWWYGLSDDARAKLKAAIARDAARHPFAKWADAAANRYLEIAKALPKPHLREIARELFNDFGKLAEQSARVAKDGYPPQLWEAVQDKKERAMVAAVFYARRLGYQPPDPPPFSAESHVEPPTPYEGLPTVAEVTPPPPAPPPTPYSVDPAERDPHRIAAARADAIRAARHYQKEAAAARAEGNIARAVIAEADAETYDAEAADLQKRLAAAARAISPPPQDAPLAPPPTLPDPPLFSAPPVEPAPKSAPGAPGAPAITGKAREVLARLAPRASLDDVRRVGCTDDKGARRIMRSLVKLDAAIEAGPDVWTLDASRLDVCPPARARAPRARAVCVGECGRWSVAPKSAPRWLAALGPSTPLYDAEGRPYTVRWALARADQLGETWHASNIAGRSDPLYDRELQARDRSAAVSDAQVAAIAQRLDLARWVSPTSAATDSAPIVWLDGTRGHVVSGNGRAAAWTIAQPSALAVRDVARSRWKLPASVARLLPDDPTQPSPLIPVRLLGDPAARDPAARLTPRADAVRLAGASQAAAAGALSTVERAVSAVRGLGLRWAESPALEWASPLIAANVDRFIEANPSFAAWSLAPLDSARRLTLEADKPSKTQHLRDVLIGMLPPEALGAGVGEAPVDRAMLGALPSILTLESRILRGAAPASWSLLAVLPAARAWSRRVPPNRLKQLLTEAESAARQETIFGAPDLDPDAEAGLLGVALGAALARASGRADPESAASEYLERVLAAAPDPRQVDLFGGPALDPADVLADVARVKIRRNPRRTDRRDLARLHSLARRWHWGRYKKAKTRTPRRASWQPAQGFALGELAALTVDGARYEVPEGHLLCADRAGRRAVLFVVPPLPWQHAGALESVEYLAEKGDDGPSWYVHDFDRSHPLTASRASSLEIRRAGSHFSIDLTRGIVG